MPNVGSLEQYRALIAASNVGYQWLWVVVALGVIAIAFLGPYVRRHHLLWAAVAFGVVARVAIMGRPTWYDEVFTMDVIKAPNFWGAIMGDVHPPLHYLVVKILTSLFGSTEFILRVPSLMASIALIYAIYRLAWDLTGERSTAQTAASLVALLGAPINYAAEARHPALLALMVIIAMIGILERRWWVLAVGAIAAAYLHAIGIVYMGVFALAAWWIGWKRVAIAVVVLSSFWVPALVFQSGQVADGFWLEPQSPLKHVVEMTLFTMDGVAPGVTALVYSVVIGWTLVGVYMSRDWLVKRGWLWVAVAVGVPLALGVASAIWHPIYLSRALLAPALLLVIAWAYAWPRVHWIWRAALGTAVALSWCGVVVLQPGPQKIPDTREMFARCEGADYVYASSINMAMQALDYALAPVRVWRHGNNIDQQLSDTARKAFGMVVIAGYVDLPEGEICLIAQISHRTTREEQNEINHIRAQFHLLQDETLAEDTFYAYQLMRWNNNVHQRTDSR